MALKKANSDEVEKIINDIEEENATDFSDVEVAEDGYVHDVPLLAGYVDENGFLHKTFTYREMNGKDEEAINKADVRANGGKLANILISRCVSEIGSLTKKEHHKDWDNIVRSLYGGDLDYMLLKIREISKGKEISIEHKCPECKTKLKTTFSIDELGVNPFNDLREIPFTLPRGYKDPKGEIHTEGVLRRITGLDRELIVPIMKKNNAQAVTMLLSRLMQFNDGAYVTNDCVSNMSTRDREYLENLISENDFGVDMSVEVTCSNCGEDLSGVIGQSNFF